MAIDKSIQNSMIANYSKEYSNSQFSKDVPILKSLLGQKNIENVALMIEN